MTSGHHGEAAQEGWLLRIEKNFIAIVLGVMTLITFSNVVARYIFNTNILWALETTGFLFAWLVLIGVSHGVRVTIHLGVDILLNAVSEGARRTLALISVGLCLAFSGLMVYGAFDYWWPFATEQAWYETNDVPMLPFLRFLEGWINEGEAYEKLPRVIPYAALPIGMILLSIAFLFAARDVLVGKRTMLIASHEAEELVDSAVRDREAGGGKTLVKGKSDRGPAKS